MTYQAKVFSVMIASPGDVATERVVAREAVLEWNSINSIDRKMVLLPIGWDTHSSPSMSGTAQAIINSQVLKQADLLIAVFWTRLGTPTGEFASGTVEEIERHIASGKPAMIYFSSAPVTPDSIDRAQYEALVNFRDSLKKRGLVSFFADVATFRSDLRRHLSQTVIRDFAPGFESTKEKSSSATHRPSLAELHSEANRTPYEPNGNALRILRQFADNDLVDCRENWLRANLEMGTVEFEIAMDELKENALVEVAGFSDSGASYQLTQNGQRTVGGIQQGRMG